MIVSLCLIKGGDELIDMDQCSLGVVSVCGYYLYIQLVMLQTDRQTSH